MIFMHSAQKLILDTSKNSSKSHKNEPDKIAKGENWITHKFAAPLSHNGNIVEKEELLQ